jgi:hypothetical protein
MHFSAPVPGSFPAPPAGVAGNPAAASEYEKLPLNPALASARLEELRNLMPSTRPKDFQESINGYCEWLSDMADAHWRIAQTFSKHDSTKGQAESERQACLKFGQLKRQAMLLKAEFLIGQKRYPEALAPLIDIVVAEPTSETGISAYQLLKQIGFSEEIAPKSQALKLQNYGPTY